MEQKTKREMLDLIQSEWTALSAILDQMEPEVMEQPGVESAWSVKDIMAHITAWEKLMILWLEESLRGETPKRPAPGEPWDDLDQFNEQLFQESKNKNLDAVLQEYREIHRKAGEIVEGMLESDLINPDRFEWRRGDPIWRLVAGNTWTHYKEHREAISRWLAAS